MSKASKILVVILSLLLVGLIAGGGVYAYITASGDTYAKHITLANRYFEMQDFDNAAVEYQRAIKKAPEKEEGYLGLARVYNAQGLPIMAETVLRQGLAKIDSAQMSLLLSVYTIPLEGSLMSSSTAAKPSLISPVQYLERLKNTTYNEYRLRNGIENTSMEGDQCLVRVSGVNADLYYDSSCVDRIEGRPFSEGVPARVVMDDILELFGANGPVTVDSLRSFGVENITPRTDDMGRSVVEFRLSGCSFTVQVENGMVQSRAWNSIQLPAQTGEGAGTGSCAVSGRVISATTGGGVPKAAVKVRKSGLRSGNTVCTLETDGAGRYLVNLDTGSYTIEVSCPGYTTDYMDLYVGSAPTMNADQFVISPTLGADQIRIVLEWGGTPRDLDSWLIGQTDSGINVITCYRQRTAFGNGQKVAELDLDDVDGYGPETTTLYDVNGVYTFSVVDFEATGLLSQSNAVVKIYVGNQSPVVVNVCSGLEYGWAVCEIDHGEVQVINGRRETNAGAVK